MAPDAASGCVEDAPQQRRCAVRIAEPPTSRYVASDDPALARPPSRTDAGWRGRVDVRHDASTSGTVSQMADPAVIGLITTATVGIVTPVATQVTQVVQARRSVSRARQDELRGVLENASTAFHTVLETLGRAGRLIQDGSASASQEAGALADVQQALDELWFQENRMAVRLGKNHPLFDAFLQGVLRFQAARRMLLDQDQSTPFDAVTFQRLREDAVEHQYKFWELSADLVGPSVGSRRGS